LHTLQPLNEALKFRAWRFTPSCLAADVSVHVADFFVVKPGWQFLNNLRHFLTKVDVAWPATKMLFHQTNLTNHDRDCITVFDSGLVLLDPGIDSIITEEAARPILTFDPKPVVLTLLRDLGASYVFALCSAQPRHLDTLLQVKVAIHGESEELGQASYRSFPSFRFVWLFEHNFFSLSSTALNYRYRLDFPSGFRKSIFRSGR